MKYKILIKYTSTFKKVFYYFYTDEETGEEYSTIDVEELNTKVKELDRIFGHENIRTIVDVDYNVNVLVNQDSVFQIVTNEEITDIYNSAYNKVFGEDGAE